MADKTREPGYPAGKGKAAKTAVRKVAPKAPFPSKQPVKPADNVHELAMMRLKARAK